MTVCCVCCMPSTVTAFIMVCRMLVKMMQLLKQLLQDLGHLCREGGPPDPWSSPHARSPLGGRPCRQPVGRLDVCRPQGGCPQLG